MPDSVDPPPDDAHAGAAPTLLENVYEHLRAIAKQRLAGEPSGHTLQATALVHEAYVRMQRHDALMALDRGAFLAAAAVAMRRVLIDHARTKRRVKRGSGRRPVLTDVAQLAGDDDADQILALNDALCRLSTLDAQAAKVVELRFFGGLSVDEAAVALGVSDRTVKRDWQFARAWLFEALAET